ncbi:HD domain-containing protein [bacterium]|nr:HD domain-containing protein [bacterium]
MPAHTSDEPWPSRFLLLLGEQTTSDAAHNPMHIRRVVTNARRLALAEGADWLTVMPAAWLHDCVIIPKSSPDRSRASQMAAKQAVTWLKSLDWPHGRLDEIAHAIEAHSYSAEIAPESLEARVLQDADRLDALGAVGLARTLMLGAEMKREFYAAADPFCDARQADDSVYTLDHLYCKLLKLEDTMQTEGGRAEARQRTLFLRRFLNQLEGEIR